jgi:hypothetical chaperone protein
MVIGFDYGTANCSVARMVNGNAELIPLVGEGFYIPSTLSAPTAEMVSEYLFRSKNIEPLDDINRSVLSRALKLNREEDLELIEGDIRFGEAALSHYLEDPRDTYYVKSPKSFLGITGLRDMQLSFFEDLVCAMMRNIKDAAEHSIQTNITETVIGRPVNFQGRGGEKSNQQAESILRRAATRAGFKNIEFQFEPVAAGLDYEATLTDDKNVLVVDIGGGTTDCSFIKMGPKWVSKPDRKDSLLAHTGQRVGGNDLDIYTAFKCFMHEFGLNTIRDSGLPIPITQFWNSIAINDVQAQRAFYAHTNVKELNEYIKETTQAHSLTRLLEVQKERLGYQLIREAEKTKIALGDSDEHRASLDLQKEKVIIPVTATQLNDAIEPPKAKIRSLVAEAIKQAGIQPDVIYMTGGSARSPFLRHAVEQVVPNTPVVSGNYFGSVTAGLTRWAEICFK